jgi:AcrR family transcriptional regulator
MSDTTQQQIDETIVQATVSLLRDVGSNFTIEQLARESGLSRATIYRRVGSKEALLQRIAHERGIDVTASPDVRQRILHAVRQAVTEYGLLNATIEQIAEAAGVGVATVYRQFGDKERLLRAFVAETTPRAAVKDIILNPSDDVAADLTAMGMIILPFLYANRDIIQLMFSANSAEQAYVRELRAGPDRLQDRLADYFALQLTSGRLQEAGDPQELALAFFGLTLAFTLLGPRYADLKLDEPERIARLIARIFVDGIGNKTTKG